MKRSKTSFPPLTWAACECGCGFEGEDDVTQFCIEEAALLAYDIEVNRQVEDEQEQVRGPERRPGQITDPKVAEAMAIAKELHAQQYGVHVP